VASNLEIYKTKEKHWGTNQNVALRKEEAYLIGKYLTNKDAKVLEAGCGGGRITLKLKDFGIDEQEIDAFDYNDQFIKNAREFNNNINFFVADASDLSDLPSRKYDYLIYLAQILCFLPKEKLGQALSEAHRVGKEGSTVLFSFLRYEGRWYNALLGAILRPLRFIYGEKKSLQELPWLKHSGKINWKFYTKDQATVYWFKEKEIMHLLSEYGFKIDEIIYNNGNKKTGTVMFVSCEIG